MLDKFENEALPSILISQNILSFNEVYYKEPITRTIELENNGHVVAHFRFIPKLDDKHICKPWLKFRPAMGMLLPGDKVELKITISIDNVSCAKLNSGADVLEDILILHLENGKDHFVSMLLT